MDKREPPVSAVDRLNPHERLRVRRLLYRQHLLQALHRVQYLVRLYSVKIDVFHLDLFPLEKHGNITFEQYEVWRKEHVVPWMERYCEALRHLPDEMESTDRDDWEKQLRLISKDITTLYVRRQPIVKQDEFVMLLYK
jgi:hypothetical protein